MKIKEFIEQFKAARVQNTKANPNEVGDYLKKELGIKTYIPFRKKREIAEIVVEQNIEVIDGIKKYDTINGYIGLVVASIAAHTNLEWSADPVADYDLLAESGLLTQIIAEFQGSHDEIDIILKMALAMELEDNNINVLIGHFLDGILKKLGDFNPRDILGADIKAEDLAKLSSFLDRLK